MSRPRRSKKPAAGKSQSAAAKAPRRPRHQQNAARGRRPTFRVARLRSLPPVACPCGTSRRAFLVPGNRAASVHWVQISKDAERHYHRRLTEIYVVLEGRGYLELDDRRVRVGPGTAVLIPPMTRHRAIGKLTVLNISVPPFDPTDEHIDPGR